MKPTYATPLPCPNCGSDDIHVMHSFGAQVACASCGVRAAKVPGSNWQDEERDAVDCWNKTVAEFNAAPYEIQKEQAA